MSSQTLAVTGHRILLYFTEQNSLVRPCSQLLVLSLVRADLVQALFALVFACSGLVWEVRFGDPNLVFCCGGGLVRVELYCGGGLVRPCSGFF